MPEPLTRVLSRSSTTENIFETAAAFIHTLFTKLLTLLNATPANRAPQPPRTAQHASHTGWPLAMRAHTRDPCARNPWTQNRNTNGNPLMRIAQPAPAVTRFTRIDTARSGGEHDQP